MNNSSHHKTRASFLTLAASAALILAGCSKTESAPQDNRTELRLTSAIEMTRAGSANTQATRIAAAITLGNSINATNEAIVVPQDIADKTLTFTLASGGKLVYTFPAGTTFESGKKYVYTVTLRLTGLSVSSAIADWVTANDIETSGEATMPDAS